MPFQVFDGGRPADCHNHKVHASWDRSIYPTFEEAKAYTRKWLGSYWTGDLLLNTPFNYSGYGDMIETREVK